MQLHVTTLPDVVTPTAEEQEGGMSSAKSGLSSLDAALRRLSLGLLGAARG